MFLLEVFLFFEETSFFCMSVGFTCVRSCRDQNYIFKKFPLYFDFLRTFYGLIGFFNNVLHATLDTDWFFERYILSLVSFSNPEKFMLRSPRANPRIAVVCLTILLGWRLKKS